MVIWDRGREVSKGQSHFDLKLKPSKESERWLAELRKLKKKKRPAKP